MPERTTHHFVTVGARRVHYTRAGNGPAVVLLHESPCSARSLDIPQDVFARQFTAIAPDTPGFGLSDPLPLAQPEIADFADALAETLTALGIARTAVYGRHTGASIAVEFARRHPDRCSVAVADGYPVYSGPQRQSRLTDYLLPIVPSWDGTHLIWLWFRYREQHVFWPWHDHTESHRADADVPDLDFLHRGVIEFLEAGDGYRLAYAAAFRHGGQGLDLLPDLRVPVCFAAREGDSLFRTLPLFPEGTWIAALARDEAQAAEQTLGLLARHPAPQPPPAPACHPIAGRSTTGYVDLGGCDMLVRAAGEDRPGLPVVVIHDLPGSSALLDPLVLALGEHRPVFAFDLPGHGETLPDPGGVPDIAARADGVLAALDRLGLTGVLLYGHGGGAAVAMELAARAPDRVAALALGAPPVLPPEIQADLATGYAPAAGPEWDGSHLLRIWHHLRDQELWWPWHDRTRAAARDGTPAIDPQDLTLRARECLKQPAQYRPAWQAVLGYDWMERRALLRCPVTVLAADRDLFARFADAAASCLGAPTPLRIAADWDARAAAILAALPAARA